MQQLATPKRGKPKLYKTGISPWGPYPVRSFMCDSQLHAAMDDYANTLSPTDTQRTEEVVFPDGSRIEVHLVRETKYLRYKDYEGEEYWTTYYGKQWEVSEHWAIADECRSVSPKRAVLLSIAPSMGMVT